MSLDPFRHVLTDVPLAWEPLQAALATWVRQQFGPTGIIVRWAVVGTDAETGGWVVEGVAGPGPA